MIRPPADPADTADPPSSTLVAPDPVSAEWLAALSPLAADRDEGVARLHELLLRVARSEAARRTGTHGLTGQELDDLAHQAADDAVVSVLRRLEDFRGESRFTTWAYKFAVYELSGKVGRHVWRREGVHLDEDMWSRLPARLGAQPDEVAESRDLVAAIRRCVEQEMTDRQRTVFVAIAVNGTPLDVLAVELDTNRNALYKAMFDARRKLRAYLVTHGHLDHPTRLDMKVGP